MLIIRWGGYNDKFWKNKDLWIEDYIKRVKVLSAQEIKLLETSWSSENNKVENYFRTDDGQGS